MADRTYTQIRAQNPAATPLTGNEVVVLTQGGITKGALSNDVAALSRGMFPCTHATRPTSPTTGTFIFETDTLQVWIWDGAAWELIGGHAPYLYCSAGANQAWTSNVTDHISFTPVTGTGFSAGVYTVPVDGVYYVSFAVKPDQSDTFLVRLSILAGGITYNGPRFTPNGLNSANEAAIIVHTAAVKVTAGQTIEARLSLSSSVTRALGENLTITFLHA